jgi:hypothetical protein
VASFDASRWLPPDSPLELTLSRPLEPRDGRLAVLVGEVDVSGMLRVDGTRVIYAARPVRLPSGESDVVVYLVKPDETWEELARLPLRVLTQGGLQKAELVPRLTLHNKGQVAEGHRPEAMRPPRPEFQDFAANFGFQSVHIAPRWQLRSQSNYMAVSNREEALRFGERRDGAPRIDLSDYLLTFERGAARVTAGHVSFGNQRHLLAGFQTRGIVTGIRLGPVARLELAGLNSSSVVGWSNLLGVSRSNHRVLAANLALELVPARPGLLQIEASAVGGASLPNAGFTQGIVNDAEESRGGAVRLAAALPSQRVRLEAGFARSRFTNPFDPTLAQGQTLVAVEPVTRSARYLDLQATLLRGSLSPSLPANLDVVVRHERVDPLYRSVAMPQVRADILQNALEVQARIGSAGLRVSHTRAHDNLDRISTILSTQSRASSANLDFPAAALFGSGTPGWLPVLTFGLTRIHQFGDSVAAAGGFAASAVPDQVSTGATVAAQAQGRIWRVALRFDRSAQDNRQAGREQADFINRTGTLSLGFTPLTSLDVMLDLALESAESRERDQESTTRRIGTALTWRMTTNTAFSGAFSTTHMSDQPRTIEQESSDLRLELTQSVNLFGARSGRSPAQLFLRYSRQFGEQLFPGQPVSARRTWTLTTGATLSLF